MTISEAAKALIKKWDECDPGEGNSWDDCCDDLREAIEELRASIGGN